MKTEFEFHFSTYEFVFKEEHKFIAEVESIESHSNNLKDIDIEEFEFRIVPSNKQPNPGTTQKGLIFITLPLPPEQSQEIIWGILNTITEKINFNNYGKFEINKAFYTGKRIPENKREEIEIGDKTHFIHMTCVEHVGEPEFDSNLFSSMSSKTHDLDLVQQHNHAKYANHPIDQFISYYKIIEDIFSTNKKMDARRLLLDSVLLKEIYLSAFDIPKKDADFNKFVNDIVDIRHKCSHLKRDSDFGYTLNDERIDNEVSVYLPIIRYVTKELILRKNAI